jgi:aminomethyltransferase
MAGHRALTTRSRGAPGAGHGLASVPVCDQDRQIGRATTTTWSPVLKKLIALATLDEPWISEGTPVEFEMTVEAVRHRVPAVVARTPFFNPARKTATPPPLT